MAYDDIYSGCNKLSNNEYIMFYMHTYLEFKKHSNQLLLNNFQQLAHFISFSDTISIFIQK